MVNDAEAHADEDKKFHEMVTVRNQADTMIHATKKSMEELGDEKMEPGEKDTIEAAIKDLEEAIKGDDKDAIEAKTKTLTDASGAMAQRLYAQQAEAGQAEAGAAGAEAQPESAEAGNDDVVDAEFEEVKENKN